MHGEDFNNREPLTKSGPYVEVLEESMVYLVVAWAVMLGTGALIHYGYNHAGEIVAFLQKHLSGTTGKGVLFTLTVAGAVGMFWLRSCWRTLYGAIEIGFAVVSIWRAAGQTLDDARYWPAIVAAAYVFVRGLDNWRQGRKAV